MIARFYDVNAGAVRIGGVDVQVRGAVTAPGWMRWRRRLTR
ncbi:hypothetical protein ACIRDW_39270 [Amycolatopsis thermoflava]